MNARNLGTAEQVLRFVLVGPAAGPMHDDDVGPFLRRWHEGDAEAIGQDWPEYFVWLEHEATEPEPNQ